MNKKTVVIVVVAVLAGVVFADKVRALPVIGARIPSL